MKRRLPIGMQTFRELRERDCYYVDKTAYVERLATAGKHYFLSRPRRFGKSLFLDTLKELFEANEPLFKGLYIHDRWDWSTRFPILRLSFGGGSYKEPGQVEASLMEQLAGIERRAGVVLEYGTAAGRLGALLEALHVQAGQPVVVLVDEYDKPILTPWTRRKWPRRTATSCAASTRPSRTTTRTCGSRSSPASASSRR